jgi:hypothetical protein
MNLVLHFSEGDCVLGVKLVVEGLLNGFTNYTLELGHSLHEVHVLVLQISQRFLTD